MRFFPVKIPFQFLNSAASIAVMVAGGWLFYISEFKKTEESFLTIGQVVEEVGTVQIKSGRAQGWTNASSQSPLFDKTSVYTEQSSRATLRVRNTIVEVDEKTLIQVLDPQKQTELFMDFGSLKLTGKKNEHVVLNVGGEKLKIYLNTSTVKIQREKKGGVLKIVGVDGPVRVTSTKRPEMNLSAGQEIKLTEEPRKPSADEKLDVAIPLPELKLRMESVYTEDAEFYKKPKLVLGHDSNLTDVKFEASTDGLSWAPILGSEFVPQAPGPYRLRARGSFHRGTEVTSKVGFWNPQFSHFRSRAPAILKKTWILDPSSDEDQPVFDDSMKSPTVVEFLMKNGGTEKKEFGKALSVADLPLEARSLKVLSLRESRYLVESREIPFEVVVTRPRVSLQKGLLVFEAIHLSDYSYQVLKRGKELDVIGGKSDPSCDEGCVVTIQYRNQKAPSWSSGKTTVTILPKKISVRKMASEVREAPQAVSRIHLENENMFVRKPWVFEFGIGGNYLNMSTSSPLTSANTQGFSGPTLFASAENDQGDRFYKASLLEVRTKMRTSTTGIENSQDLNWRSLWGGFSTSGLWIFPRLEYGVSYQSIPVFYQNSLGAGAFSSGGALSASVGFNSQFRLGRRGMISWDQRLLIPATSQAGTDMESFSPNFGIDGSLTYIRCLENSWSVGGSWLGQYANFNFKLPQSSGVQAESGASSMLNSNFQVRLQYGLCGSSTR